MLEGALYICAQGWLRQFVQDFEADRKQLEPFLKAKVLQTWRQSPEVTAPTALLAFWDRFGDNLSEDDFRAWLDRNTVQLSPWESVSIGNLIVRNGWTQAAKAVSFLLEYRARRDLAGAIHECAGLLDLWGRLSVACFTTTPMVSPDEWWQTWLDLSEHLYPRGVDEEAIWERADGDRSRIKGASGREQWKHGLDLLRKGGAGGTMTTEGLLHQMRKHFSFNSQLKLLERVYLETLRSK